MIRRGAVREYVTGSLWVLPGVRALLALLVGSAFGPDRRQLWLAVGAAGVPGHRGTGAPGRCPAR